MNRPTRATTAGRIYLDLAATARRLGRPTDELFVLYVLERFLFRLSRSPLRETLVLKGGMLLAALDERRATRDVDLLARATDNDPETVARLVRDILAIDVDDGVAYEPSRLTAAVIRDDDTYAGVRIAVPARLHRSEHPLRIDVNVGDPVTPAPIDITYPALPGPPFTLLGYPLETVLAEKIVTMIDRGDTTTRERDFADVFLLIRRHRVDASALRRAIAATAAHRGSDLRPLTDVLVLLGTDRQGPWARFVARSGLAGQVPAILNETIAAVSAFADPVLNGSLAAGRWDPTAGQWTTTRSRRNPSEKGLPPRAEA